MIRVSALSEKLLAIELLDSSALERVRSLPNRKYVSRYRHFEMPVFDENVRKFSDLFSKDEVDATPDAQLILRYIELRSQQAERKQARRWEYVFEDKVPEIGFDFYTQPYKHQIVALDAIHGSEFFGLFMEQGTGKTKVVLDEIRWSYQAASRDNPDRILKVLIVPPAGVTHNWVKEMRKHWPQGFPYESWILNLLPKAVDQMIECARSKAKIKVLICAVDRATILQDFLLKFKFDIMVVDELARLKNPATKRSKACHRIANETADRRFGLTGTPVVNTVNDLYSEFEFLSPGCLGFSSFYAFSNRYGDYISVGAFKNKRIGNRHLEELKTRMAKYSFMVKKEDCLDLPKKIYETRSIAMSDKQLAVYNEMLTWFVASFGEGDDKGSSGTTSEATAAIAQLVKLRQIACGFIKNQNGEEVPIPGPNPKIDQLKDDLEDMVDNKVIIWRAFTYDDHQIEQALQAMGWKWVKIIGGMRTEDRFANVTAFNEDDSIRAVIAAPQCAGEGLDLLGSKDVRCDTAIYWSNDYALGPRLQSEDRCHRIGQDRPVTYIDYTMENSIEEAIADALQNKRDLAAELTSVQSIKDILLGHRKEEALV